MPPNLKRLASRKAEADRSYWVGQRMLLRPRLDFHALRIQRDAPLAPALIYQHCPMMMATPTAIGGPNPEEWCRPLDRSPWFGARLEGKPVVVDRVWTSQSLQPVSPEKYAVALCRVAVRGCTEAVPSSAERSREALAPFSAMLPEQGRPR